MDCMHLLPAKEMVETVSSHTLVEKMLDYRFVDCSFCSEEIMLQIDCKSLQFIVLVSKVSKMHTESILAVLDLIASIKTSDYKMASV